MELDKSDLKNTREEENGITIKEELKVDEQKTEVLKTPENRNAKSGNFIQKLKNFFQITRNRIIFESVLGVIVIVVVGLILWRWNASAGTNSDTTKPKSESAPPTVEATGISILDGSSVPAALANRHPLGVIVENHQDARPQSGLSSASIVYEAIAEGGITRYLALFSGYNATKIGPIRSARTYFVDISKEYQAYLAHVGGNFDALEQIKAQKILDLDQFQNSAYYYRDTAKKVSSEHTVYSSSDKLYEASIKKSYSTANNFTPLKFKTDAAESLRPASEKISIEFGSQKYISLFEYNPKTNSYDRTNGGLPDQDLETGKRISPKNLILQEVNRAATLTKINEQGYIFSLTSSGKAKIFRDGKMVAGTWSKAGDSRTIFKDDAGVEIQLNPGQTWIAITHPELKVTIE